ncbi:TPA: reverse transcriptase family protein, partial [Haemophilus influenzae]
NVFLKKIYYPEYLQGSLAKRDYLTNANIHTNSKCILTEDIRNFFPSISKDIVVSIWKNIFHFPYDVSETLAELITYKGFLVQGSPVSSYIANLALWYKEPELVNTLSQKGFIYTRYVDDISVSSKRPITKKEKTRIIRQIHTMLSSIGVELNRKKHKIMPRNNRQEIHRVNVNTNAPTLPKKEREKIESAVHQCEMMYKSSPKSSEYKTLFNATQGRVNMLSRLHSSLATKLKCRLEKIKPIKNT